MRKTMREAAEYSTSTANCVLGVNFSKHMPNEARKQLISLHILNFMGSISVKR
jgi:hypothetical protein